MDIEIGAIYFTHKYGQLKIIAIDYNSWTITVQDVTGKRFRLLFVDLI